MSQSGTMAETNIPFFNERRIAELAVQRAAMATEHVRKQHIANAVSWKADHSPVSVADYASQALLMAAIRGAFPDARIVAEETSEDLKENKNLLDDVWRLFSRIAENCAIGDPLASPSSPEELLKLFDLNAQDCTTATGLGMGLTWTMDPIDGTMTYLEGTQYTIAVALLLDGIEQVGVIGCPRLSATDDSATGCDGHVVAPDEEGCLVSAIRGHGAQIRPLSTDGVLLLPARAIPRRSEGQVDITKLRFSENARSVRPLLPERHRIASLLGGVWNPMQICSTQLRYVVCALGRCDVVTRIPTVKTQYTHVWDHAGGMLIFSEAGGKTTDLEGKEIDCAAGRRLDNNFGTLGAPASVHAAVLEAVRKVLREYSTYELA